MSKKNLASYPEWVRSLKPGAGTLTSAMAEARSEGRFEQINPGDVADDVPTNVFRLGNDSYDFTPLMASGPGFSPHLSSDEAFKYLVYRKTCERKGVEAGPFVDMRYVVTSHGVVTAQEVIEGTDSVH